MICLETFNKNQLEKLINSKRFSEYSFLPITKHRAVSHINNPSLSDNDVTLILALEDDKLAGYIGIMGDCLVNRGKEITVGWLSTLYVHPDFRGKKIAQRLLNEACEKYEGKILITEFTQEAAGLYFKSKMFRHIKSLRGMSYYFWSNLQEILPSKNHKWKRILFFIKFIDLTINSFLKIKYKLNEFPITSFEIKNNIDSSISEFIDKYKKQNCFKRKLPEISWIVKYPWVLSGTTFEQRNYQFSDHDAKFENVFIKIYKEEIFRTLLILSVRNSKAKLLFVIGDNDPQTSSEVLREFVIKNNISNLICFDDDINKYFNNIKILFRKERIRNFLAHNNLLETLGNDFVFDVSSGDSDAVFT